MNSIKQWWRGSKTSSPKQSVRYVQYPNLWKRWHIDLPLLLGLLILAIIGLIVLYSASGKDMLIMTEQGGHLLISCLLMIGIAQIPPNKLQIWATTLFITGVILLAAVLVVGKVGKGAQRWLALGSLRFQPSEIAKIAVPMMLAWYYNHRHLPPKLSEIAIGALLLIIPVLLTAKQPDLGTAIIIAIAGGSVIFLAGMPWKLLILVVGIGICSAPFIWHHLHEFQRERVLTFLNPEHDPLGSGYHIIQSKIAVGSGGIFGKGWLNGTQSHLHFLPEHTTDFIFAVIGEEFGLLGCGLLFSLYLFIFLRCFYISSMAQDTYSRLLSGSISLTFALCVLINIGMVTGVVPVVGIPLPLISYGGTAMTTLFIGFGMLMSIHTHRKLLGS